MPDCNALQATVKCEGMESPSKQPFRGGFLREGGRRSSSISPRVFFPVAAKGARCQPDLAVKCPGEV
jgi:hypothetical protein